MEGQKESPEYSVYAVKNTRRLMEDRHVVIPNLLSQFKDKGDNHNHYSYYAIFDGHAGPDAAQFAADNLHKNLVESSFFKSGNISDAFRYAYATTDFQYTEKSLNDGIKSGCTAVTCLLENNSRLYMAWVGDSVALVSRNGKPYFIMEPHNLERDDEKERVESMGGAVIHIDTWRVNGTLGVSRAIGDPEYKPYVCADPDIECIELDGTEDFVIIGCDGLWDRMTPEDAIGLIYEYLQTNSHLGVNELVNSTAQILSDKSIKDGSCDNVTTIVLFLKDVASILNSIASYKLSSASNNTLYDNNGYVDYGNGNININSNGNGTGNGNINLNATCNNNNNNNNGLVHGLDYDDGRSPITIDNNGLISEEVIGSGGVSDGFILSSEDKKRVEGGDGAAKEREESEEEEEDEEEEEGKERKGKKEEKEKKKEEEKVNLGSTLNPFADEFQPNISNIIGSGEIGNEPKKDDEESHKNEKLDKKDLWMSEFKDDENNDQHEQQQQQQHDQKQQQQHKQIEMFDGLVDNGMSDSENLSCSGGLGNQQSTSNLSSSEYEDNLSSEMIIHDIEENKTDFQQLPSAPELVFIEQDHHQHQQQLHHQLEQLQQLQQQQQSQSQYATMEETNLISQADTFVGNLTPNEVYESSPTVTTVTTSTTTTTSSSSSSTKKPNDIDSEFTFDTQLINSTSDVNQYITSVSDGMVSEHYHDPYFASDSVEPQSIIVNQSDDVISSGPHAIDPYSEKDDKLESVSIKGNIGGSGVDDDDDDDDDDEGGEGEGEEDALNNSSSTGKINIEDTQSIPLESLNPFDCGNNNNSNNNSGIEVGTRSVGDEFGVDISTGDETKCSFYEDNPDNSCGGLLDFSDDQVNTIVITPNASGYLMNESKLSEDQLEEKLDQQLNEYNKVSEMKRDEDDGENRKKGKEEEEKEKEKERIEKGMDEMRICEAEEKAEDLSSIAEKSSQLNLQENSTILTTETCIINQSDQSEKVDSESTEISSQGVEITSATAVAAAAGVAIVGGTGIGVAALSSKSDELLKKETISKTTVSKKATVPSNKVTTSRSATSTSTSTLTSTSKPTTTTTTTNITRKPLASSSRLTGSVKSNSSLATSKLSTSSRQPTSTSTSTSKSTSTTSTSRVGITSTLNKRPTQTSTTSSTTSRVSTLASRTTTSASSKGTTSSSSSSSTTTSKPLTRTTNTTTSSSLSSRRPGTFSSSNINTNTNTSTSTSSSGTVKAPIRSTLTSRSTSATSRTNPSTTATKSSTISKTGTGTGTGIGTGMGIGLNKTGVAPKRASTGNMLNRPSPGASSLINKSSASALNRSLTNSSSSSRPGGASTASLLKSSTRPSTTSSSLSSSSTRAPFGGAPSRTLGTKSSSAATSKLSKSTTPSTSTNKVAVPRLGAGKKTTATGSSSVTTAGGPMNDNNRLESSSSASPLSGGIAGDEGTTTTTTTTNTNPTVTNNSNYSSEQEKTSCSTPVDAITNSIKREKNLMPNSANSLKDELEAALASPISCEDKGVIKETKDDEPSENL